MNKICQFGICMLVSIGILAQDKNEIQGDFNDQWDEARVNSESVFTDFLDAYDLIGEERLFAEHESIILENLNKLKYASKNQKIDGVSFTDDGIIIVNTDKFPQFLNVDLLFGIMVADFEHENLRSDFIRKLYHKGFNPSDQHLVDAVWKDGQNNLQIDIYQEIQRIFADSNFKNLNELDSASLSVMTDQEYMESHNFLTQATTLAYQRIATKFFTRLTHASQRALLSSLFEIRVGTVFYRPPITVEAVTEKHLREDHLKALKGANK